MQASVEGTKRMKDGILKSAKFGVLTDSRASVLYRTLAHEHALSHYNLQLNAGEVEQRPNPLATSSPHERLLSTCSYQEPANRF